MGAVEKAQDRAQSASPPPPSYDPQVAVQRVVSDKEVKTSPPMRLKAKDSRPQLDVDDHFSPLHRRDSGLDADGQPISVSNAAVSGHRGLESSRMLEDYESMPVMDADHATD